MDENKNIEVGGRLHSIATGNIVTGANEVLDDDKNKKQSDINAETDAALEDRYTKEQTYSKSELNNMITTPNQEYVSVTATAQTTAVTDLLPATGEADTVYRVGNWDGSQFDASVYSEYAWNGSQYVHLSTKTRIGEVFDISAYHATGGTLATYADLSAALDGGNNIPQSLRKGGMSIKYVQSSDNKYVQYRLLDDSFTTDVTQWQGVDDEPTAWSDNLVKSRGVAGEINSIKLELDSYLFSRDYGVGKSITNNLLFPLHLKKDTVYRFKLTENSTVSSVYFYVRYKGTSNLVNKGTIGTGYGVKSFDEEVDAFALYNEDSLSNARTVEFIIDLKGEDIKSRLSNVEERVSDLQSVDTNNELLLLNENSNVAYGGIVRQFKANKGSEIKLVPYFFEANVPYYIRLSENSGKNGGTFYVRYEGDDSNTNLGTISKTAKRITLERNAIGFAYYDANTPNTDYTIGVEIMKYDGDSLSSKTERIDNKHWNDNVFYGSAFKKTIDFSGNSSSINDNHTPLYIKSGDSVIIDISTVTAKGTIYLYLLGKNLEQVSRIDCTIYNGDGKIGNTITSTPNQDVYFLGYYFASANVTQAGEITIEITQENSLAERVNKMTPFDLKDYRYDVLVAPCNKVVSGKSGYVFEKLLDIDVVPGEEIYVHVDSMTGVLSGGPITFIWMNGSTTISTLYNDGLDFVEVVPDNVTRLIVRLYPYYGGSVLEVNAAYNNLYIIRGKRNICVEDVPVPHDYYFANGYLYNKITRINNLHKACASHGDIFFFITDTHYDGSNTMQSYKLLDYISRRTCIEKLIFGGDGADGENKGRHTFVNHLNQLGLEMHYAYGNHEYLNYNTDDELFRTFRPKTKGYVGDCRHNYFYFDDAFKKIRYIILAAYAESEAVQTGDISKSRTASRGYSEEQVTWLQNVALQGTPAGYDIVIVTHRLFEVDINNDVLWNFDTNVISVIDSYKETSGAHILVMTGHAHRDRIYYTSQNVPIVITTCDKNKPWPSQAQIENPESEYYGWRQDLNVDRTAGTINEQAFDVCVIDTESHTLTAVRIGAKARDGVGNNPGNEVEERTITY